MTGNLQRHPATLKTLTAWKGTLKRSHPVGRIVPTHENVPSTSYQKLELATRSIALQLFYSLSHSEEIQVVEGCSLVQVMDKQRYHSEKTLVLQLEHRVSEKLRNKQ